MARPRFPHLGHGALPRIVGQLHAAGNEVPRPTLLRGPSQAGCLKAKGRASFSRATRVEHERNGGPRTSLISRTRMTGSSGTPRALTRFTCSFDRARGQGSAEVPREKFPLVFYFQRPQSIAHNPGQTDVSCKRDSCYLLLKGSKGNATMKHSFSTAFCLRGGAAHYKPCGSNGWPIFGHDSHATGAKCNRVMKYCTQEDLSKLFDMMFIF